MDGPPVEFDSSPARGPGEQPQDAVATVVARVGRLLCRGGGRLACCCERVPKRPHHTHRRGNESKRLRREARCYKRRGYEASNTVVEQKQPGRPPKGPAWHGHQGGK